MPDGRGAPRDRLTADLFLPGDPQEALGRLEHAFALVTETAPLIARIPRGQSLDEAVAAGVLTTDEAGRIREAAAARQDALEADSFSLEEYLGMETTAPPSQPGALPQAEEARAFGPSPGRD